ncbi:MAG: asparaginase [Thermoprotei archaeon]|nr:MAG: asparaginase [Thermoprotei archaeon]
MPRVVFVHGGAGRWSAIKDRRAYEKALREAALEGYKALLNGSAVDAVEAAIKYLEDSGLFNAGKGAVLNFDGEIEMDAGIMYSKGLRVGAVACVRNVKNPIVLARKVMELESHILITGKIATALMKSFGIKELKENEIRKDRVERFLRLKEEFKKSGKVPYSIIKGCIRHYVRVMELSEVETVGAVALDAEGDLAAGASTGGIWLKAPGRIGDSPIPGAGYYADNIGAASATGIGEIILRTCACIRTCMLMALGLNPQDATRAVVNYVTEVMGRNNIGIIAIDHKGRIGCAYNTEGMARAYMRDGMRAPDVRIVP